MYCRNFTLVKNQDDFVASSVKPWFVRIVMMRIKTLFVNTKETNLNAMKRYYMAILTVCTLNIALFVYAATTKLLDYSNFKFGISESPFIAPLAGILAWAVPAGELIIAGMLVIPALRLAGLYASFILMLLFTIYIGAMLLFGSDIPCSCGGVLEEMSWPAHIVFNSVFVLLSGFGIYWHKKRKQSTHLPALA
jgi:uncharacterized membrane protein YphA (DoxX/SURF4 family)